MRRGVNEVRDKIPRTEVKVLEFSREMHEAGKAVLVAEKSKAGSTHFLPDPICYG